jgi:hypothetical protein
MVPNLRDVRFIAIILEFRNYDENVNVFSKQKL